MAILLFAMLAGTILAGYFTPREHILQLFSLWTFLFAAFTGILYLVRTGKHIQTVIAGAFIIRLTLLFMTPNLSPDYIRFIWDGQLISHGINPFSHLPPGVYPAHTESIPLADTLFSQLNALQRSNYTCYPPFNQAFFYMAALLFPGNLTGNIIVLRLFIILADLGTVLTGIKILKLTKKPVKHILFYAINPLVILELTGNLHFEGIMIFFLTLALYFMLKSRYGRAAIALSLSISVKLIPLIFIPVFIKKTGLKKGIFFTAITALLTLILLLPVIPHGNHAGFLKSITLYFQNFEFNASIFYILRYIGFQTKGYDRIALYGPALSVISLVVIIGISLIRKNSKPLIFIHSLLFIHTVYYLLAMVVHPWYIIPVLALSVFGNYRFPLVWSFTIFFTYYSYTGIPYKENMWIIFFEYVCLAGMFIHEVLKMSKHNGSVPSIRKWFSKAMLFW